MIQSGTFKNYSYKQKYEFITNILSRVKQKTLFDDLRDVFKVIEKPNEKILINIFEIIESILVYAQKKNEAEKNEWFTLIQDKLKQMKEEELLEENWLEKKLEDLLLQIQ